MNFIRGLIQWIGRHLILSAAMLIGILAFVYLSKVWIERSDGVLSEPIARGTIVQSVYGIGTVSVNRSLSIKPGVIDQISELYVREGDQVRKGAPLLRLENVSWRAPFAGTVTFLPFKIGETVFPQTVVLTLVDLTDRYLVVSLEQQGALQVKRGQKVKVSFDTVRDQNYEGEVRSVYSNESNFLARIEVSGLPERILPGMTADVAIEIRAKEQALLVPVAALERGHVWVKRGKGMPVQVDVSTGIVDKSTAEVSDSSLVPGDRVLIRRNLTR